MNKYRCSDGQYISKSKIDRKVLRAKKDYKESYQDNHGYLVCERCGMNTCNRLQMSHIVSVDQCQKNGQSEMAWDVHNLELLGHSCHMKIESWPHKKRVAWYNARINMSYAEFIDGRN